MKSKRSHLCPVSFCFSSFYEFNLLKPSGYFTYHQFNIQQFNVQPTQCIYVFFYVSENKQRLFPYTTLTDWFL